MLSNCVECQELLGRKFGFHACLRLSIAFKMHTIESYQSWLTDKPA